MSTRRRAGIVGAVVGLAAAGIATGIAVERAVVRRSKRGASDPYVDEPFDRLPYDESLVVTTADGTDIHVEVVEPRVATNKPTIVFVHGFCLDMGTFHFQRSALTARGEHRMVFYDQ